MNPELHRAVVHQFLLSLRGREILFFPNPGNAGDALIGAGTHAAFRRAGLDPAVADIDTDVTGKVVVMAGGGAMLGTHGPFPEALRAFLARAEEVVVLPHTVADDGELLGLLDHNTTIFARELTSYQILARHCTKPTVLLAPDMAFHLDAEAFLADPEVAPAGQRWFDALLRHNAIDFESVKNAPRAYFARTDWEKKSDIGGQHFDASTVFGFGIWGERGWAASWCLLNAVRQARAVTTDRLHVGIAAALLNKDCELYDNIYGKNRSIYEYSLKFHYRNVKFRQV